MTIIAEKKRFISSLKFKLIVYFLSVIFIMIVLCLIATSPGAFAKLKEKEVRLSVSKKTETNYVDNSPIEASFLKSLPSRWEDLNSKIQKDHIGYLFLTKAELQELLNSDPALKHWQKYSVYYFEGDKLFEYVFYPVNEIPILKFIPGIASRVCCWKLAISPDIVNQKTIIKLISISLPHWQNPLKMGNISWTLKFEDNIWKSLQSINIKEFGVFMKFEQKIESGR